MIYRYHLVTGIGFCFHFIVFITFGQYATACTCRTNDKAHTSTQMTSLTTTTTQRPNITFPIYSCPPTYAAWYCLNDATCFTVEIQNVFLYNCECANGFMGPRCEYKEIDGSYLPTRQRAMLETASIASGATLALIFMLIVCLMLYTRHDKKLKLKLNENGGDGNDRIGDAAIAHENGGMDEVDGLPIKVRDMRPFGSHHYHKIPLATIFKR